MIGMYSLSYCKDNDIKPYELEFNEKKYQFLNQLSELTTKKMAQCKHEFRPLNCVAAIAVANGQNTYAMLIANKQNIEYKLSSNKIELQVIEDNEQSKLSYYNRNNKICCNIYTGEKYAEICLGENKIYVSASGHNDVAI